MSYIYYNAVHEAGHTVLALCNGCHVTKIYIHKSLLLTTNWNFDPRKTAPVVPYAIQLAGSIAVQIQNEKLNTSDDDGFGIADIAGSDANWIKRIGNYLKLMGLSDDELAKLDETLRQIVRETLLTRWAVVEAIASEAASIMPSTPPINDLPQLSATQIAQAVEQADPMFYSGVKAYLTSA